MTADREAMTLEQVRDVLARRYGGSEACLDVNTCELMGAMINGIDSHIYQLKNIMDNVKQRTAQLDSSIARFSHAAEPVAWVYYRDGKVVSVSIEHLTSDQIPCYTHPQPAQDAKDAARYRWLREHHDSLPHGWHVRNPTSDIPGIGTLDAELDVAMSQESER